MSEFRPVPGLVGVVINAVPVADPRARATSRGGNVQMYKPTKIKNADGTKKDHPIVLFKATVRHVIGEIYKGPVLEAPLRLDLTFIMPRPKGMIWKTKPMPRVPHEGKPDRDNLDKGTMDSLKGLVWRDDCQVFGGELWKWIASGSETPHVRMSLYEWVR